MYSSVARCHSGTMVGGEIVGVFVGPQWQNRGLGTELMRRLEEAARAGGCPEVRFDVSLPARAFYEGLGYRMGERRFEDVGEGQRLDYWSARKQLHAAP